MRPDTQRISNLIAKVKTVPLDATGSQLEDFGGGDDEEIVDFVTCVGLGINCPRCGKATEEVDIDIDENTEAHCFIEGRSSNQAPLQISKSGEKQSLKQNSLWCSPCGDFSLTCSLCQMAVRGAGYFCASCGHGGHTGHMREWFELTVECSSGCGCRCGELAVTGSYSMSGTGRDYQTQSTKDKNVLSYWGAARSPRGVDPAKESSRSVKDDRQSSGKEYFPYDSETSSDSTVTLNGSTGSESEYESDSDSDCVDDTAGNNTNRQSRGGDESHQLDLNDSYRSFNEDWDTET